MKKISKMEKRNSFEYGNIIPEKTYALQNAKFVTTYLLMYITKHGYREYLQILYY